MINKKNVLGKNPEVLAEKDAIHVAIVSVRAAHFIRPGQRCSLNQDREAVADNKGIGVADPFLKSGIANGQYFWLLLNQTEIPNVRHTWEHPSIDFSAPNTEVKYNRYLQEYADKLKISYGDLMKACEYAVENDVPAEYTGTLSHDELSIVLDEEIELYDLWSEWSDETGHEFENYGSACCPEYEYPKFLF